MKLQGYRTSLKNFDNLDIFIFRLDLCLSRVAVTYSLLSALQMPINWDHANLDLFVQNQSTSSL